MKFLCAWCESEFPSAVEADKHATNCPRKLIELTKMRAGK